MGKGNNSVLLEVITTWLKSADGNLYNVPDLPLTPEEKSRNENEEGTENHQKRRRFGGHEHWLLSQGHDLTDPVFPFLILSMHQIFSMRCRTAQRCLGNIKETGNPGDCESNFWYRPVSRLKAR